MNEALTVFGFGSFFADRFRARDINLLLLHQSGSRQSCEFAVSCKTALLEAFPTADVVMLSEPEADSSQFILRSGAVPLGNVSLENLDADLQAVVRQISSAQAQWKPSTRSYGGRCNTPKTLRVSARTKTH